MPFRTLGRLTKDTVKMFTEPVTDFVYGATEKDVRCVDCDRVLFTTRPTDRRKWRCKRCSSLGRLEHVIE